MQSNARRNQLNLPHGTEAKTGNAKNGEQPESVVSVREKETGPIYVVVLAGNFHYDLSRNHNRLTSRGQSVLGTSYYTV